MGTLAVLSGLFFTAFIAATIFPMQSEALLTGLLVKTDFSPVLLVAVASAGNVLGSCVNWLLGRYIEHFKDKKWFPANPKQLERAQAHYKRWGRWSLLLSWVPLLGDPITIMAGVMREKLTTFIILVTIAKTSRYIVVTLLTLQYVRGIF